MLEVLGLSGPDRYPEGQVWPASHNAYGCTWRAGGAGERRVERRMAGPVVVLWVLRGNLLLLPAVVGSDYAGDSRRAAEAASSTVANVIVVMFARASKYSSIEAYRRAISALVLVNGVRPGHRLEL